MVLCSKYVSALALTCEGTEKKAQHPEQRKKNNCCMCEDPTILNLMAEIRNANSVNCFSDLFPPAASPDCIYLACCREDICFLPCFTQRWLPLECLKSCGASLSLLLSQSPRKAVSSCTRCCLWPRKPLCHKWLGTWESIQRKCHCIGVITLFLRHPV